MRPTPNELIEPYRVTNDPLFASTRFDKNNGVFLLPLQPGLFASIIAADGGGWEHVSVTLLARHGHRLRTVPRTPTWEEMDTVKRAFWDDTETVVQYHVPASDHINVHEFCLHLWRPIDVAIPLPPVAFV